MIEFNLIKSSLELAWKLQLRAEEGAIALDSKMAPHSPRITTRMDTTSDLGFGVPECSSRTSHNPGGAVLLYVKACNLLIVRYASQPTLKAFQGKP